MPTKNSSALASFMKKQIVEKSNKKTLLAQNLFANEQQQDQQDQGKEDQKEEQTLTEEEEQEKKELEEAKKASRSKASQADQTEMFKKLLIQNAIKFVVLIGSMLILAYGVIEVGPKIISSLNGAVIKAVVNSAR